MPRPQLYTYSAYTKHKSGWLACRITAILAFSCGIYQTLSRLFVFPFVNVFPLYVTSAPFLLYAHRKRSQLLVKLISPQLTSLYQCRGNQKVILASGSGSYKVNSNSSIQTSIIRMLRVIL